MGKSGKIAKVYKPENQWTIDSNLEVVTQEGLDKPFYDFQKEGDVLLITKEEFWDFRRTFGRTFGSNSCGVIACRIFESSFRDKLLT